jgi:hypothetical protein
VLTTLQSCLWEREEEGEGVKREEEVVSPILSGHGEKEKNRKGGWCGKSSLIASSRRPTPPLPPLPRIRKRGERM